MDSKKTDSHREQDESVVPSANDDDKSKQTRNACLTRAFWTSFLVSTAIGYVLYSGVRLKQSVERLNNSDAKAERILSDLRAELRAPIEIENPVDENTEDAY